jgi:hypothetical protein
MTAVTLYGVPEIRYLVPAGIADVTREGFIPGRPGMIPGRPGMTAAPTAPVLSPAPPGC